MKTFAILAVGIVIGIPAVVLFAAYVVFPILSAIFPPPPVTRTAEDIAADSLSISTLCVAHPANRLTFYSSQV